MPGSSFGHALRVTTFGESHGPGVGAVVDGCPSLLDLAPVDIQRELDRYLPFLATTKVLIAAVRAGMGREAAHEVIKEHAVAVALAMRERGTEPDLVDRLAADPRLPLDRAALDAALADRSSFTGAAGSQIDRVVAEVAELVNADPKAAAYTPGAIL